MSAEFYGWTAGTRRDGEQLLADIAAEHGIPTTQFELRPASDGDGWSVYLP